MPPWEHSYTLFFEDLYIFLFERSRGRKSEGERERYLLLPKWPQQPATRGSMETGTQTLALSSTAFPGTSAGSWNLKQGSQDLSWHFSMVCWCQKLKLTPLCRKNSFIMSSGDILSHLSGRLIMPVFPCESQLKPLLCERLIWFFLTLTAFSFCHLTDCLWLYKWFLLLCSFLLTSIAHT